MTEATSNGPSPGLLARLAKSANAHKYDHGHVLVLAGGVGKGGAARLAAKAALRVGAGLVTLAPPPAAIMENACHLTSIMLRPMPDAAALTGALQDPRLNAVCLGPGLGLVPRTREFVHAILATGRAAVLDADALSIFADDPQSLFAALHPRAVLTPHMGEFARLFPSVAEDMRGARTALQHRQLLHQAAENAHAVVLLKGPVTRIADPSGTVVDHDATGPRMAPWLATAGSGDVLAGLITGLLARGFSPIEAAHLGAWLHVEASRAVGPGLIAEDLPDAIPQVFRQIGLA
ncbi:MAG: NAD(P)H-hydrate dehydratase [Pseudomonadota bacterium]